MIAAEFGDREILNLLIQNRYHIEKPHAYGCSCEECQQMTDIRRSQIAINSFSGLTRPEYICLRYLNKQESDMAMDPLTQAFELNKQVQERAKDEPALKNEYLELSRRCMTFATDLCNCCNSSEETYALFGIDEEDDKKINSQNYLSETSKANVVARIRHAIKCHHKEFVAHRHTEELLNAVVYPPDLPKVLEKNIFLKALAFILYTIFFPLLALIYIVDIIPCSPSISAMMRTPFFKFISHISQFLIFFILTAASALRDSHRLSGLEYLIFITVFGMIIQEIMVRRRHESMISYFCKWWNVINTIMLGLFVLAALCWIIGFGITGGWTVEELSLTFDKGDDGYHFLLMGNSFFSLGIVASVFHLVDLFQVNSVLGPLQLSLYLMILDVMKFLLFFVVIFFAFVFGQLRLYHYYNCIQEELAAHSKKNFNIHTDRNEHFSTFSQSTLSMFWALFDKTDLEDFDTKDKMFEITQQTGKLLFAFYSICAIMVALNMLIAMMSTSYSKITQYDTEWKFVRAKLWLEFNDRGTLPAPYNLLAIRTICGFFKTKLDEKKKKSKRIIQIEEKSQAKREKIITRLLHRYLRNQESQRKKEVSTVQDIEEIKSEIKALKGARNNNN